MKENGFSIGLLIVTLVLGGALVAFGIQQRGKYALALDAYNEAKDEVVQMARIKPFPTQENLEERKKEVTAFRGKVEALQNSLQGYRPEELENIAPSEFQNRLVQKAEALKEVFDKEEIGYPEQFALGFERYREELANKEATGKLNYQMEAMDWFFRELAKVRPYSIRNVVRESLPSEGGKKWKDDLPNEMTDLYQGLPLEIVFLTPESALRDFLNVVTSSNEYFFTVDSVVVSNENTSAPVRAQAGFEEEVVAEEPESGGFGSVFDSVDFNEEGEESAPAEEEQVEEELATVDSSRILGQVLGREGVYVGLQLRLLLFQEPTEIPEFK